MDFIGAVIAIIVGLTLYSPVSTTVDDIKANMTNATLEGLVGLVPILYIVGVIVASIAWMGLNMKGQ